MPVEGQYFKLACNKIERLVFFMMIPPRLWHMYMSGLLYSSNSCLRLKGSMVATSLIPATALLKNTFASYPYAMILAFGN
jgi:hypothetical protein